MWTLSWNKQKEAAKLYWQCDEKALFFNKYELILKEQFLNNLHSQKLHSFNCVKKKLDSIGFYKYPEKKYV